jgi:hypothetical protein
MEIPVVGVVPIQEMSGDDEVDTTLLRAMCIEAKQYLESFDWCEAAQPVYWGGGVGKVFSIFLFEIVASKVGIDRWLWVVVGDIPHLYLVLDECKSPSDVLRAYRGLMEQWIELARQGRRSPDLPPTGVEPAPEWATELEQRLRFIRTNVAPFLLKA